MKKKKGMLTDDKTRIGYQKGNKVEAGPTIEEMKKYKKHSTKEKEYK